jgi:hypothetical protein
MDERQRAAAFVRRYLDGTMTLSILYEDLEASEDPLIRAAVAAVLHEPQRKGFVAVSEKQWRRTYWEPLQGLLAELDKGPAGIAPEERPVPKVGLRHILGWCVFSLWAGASAAEHAVEGWRVLDASSSLPVWSLFFRTFGMVAMSFVTLAGIGAVRDRMFLYRTRRDPRQWGRFRGPQDPG